MSHTNLSRGFDPTFLVRMLVAVSLLFGAGVATATIVILEYNPRTKVAILTVEGGRSRAVMTAAGKQIEQLITTAKQVSVDARTGIVTAVVDADLTKLRNEFGDQMFKGADNVIEEIFLTLTSPAGNFKLSGNSLPICGNVSDPTVREVVLTVSSGVVESARRIRIPVKNGKFEGQVEVAVGNTQLDIEVRNPAGKRTTRTVTVTVEPKP